MSKALDALAILQEGNARFVEGTSHYDPALNAVERSRLLGGQSPIAVVLG